MLSTIYFEVAVGEPMSKRPVVLANWGYDNRATAWQRGLYHGGVEGRNRRGWRRYRGHFDGLYHNGKGQKKLDHRRPHGVDVGVEHAAGFVLQSLLQMQGVATGVGKATTEQMASPFGPMPIAYPIVHVRGAKHNSLEHWCM